MKKSKILKVDNKGAAMVMVIVIIAFVSVLTTILLYLANMNYQMKSTDYKTKVSFYGAEVPLEELRVLMTKDVSIAAKSAYESIEYDYASMTAANRNSMFQTKFIEEYLKIWELRTQDVAAATPSYWDWQDGLEAAYASCSAHPGDYHILMDDQWDGTKCDVSSCSKAYHIIMNDTNLATDRLKSHVDSSTGKMSIQLDEIKVVYTENAFTSMVSSKMIVHIPEIDWSVEACDNSWDADDTTNKAHERTRVDFDKCVLYFDWAKQ